MIQNKRFSNLYLLLQSQARHFLFMEETKKEELGEARVPWTDLPKELLLHIAELLKTCIDIFRFLRQVSAKHTYEFLELPQLCQVCGLTSQERTCKCSHCPL